MKRFDSYEEAVEHSYKVPWKTKVCGSGNECWCRRISPEEEYEYKYGDAYEEYYIAGAGSLSKKDAEYIINLHNKSIKE